MRTKEALDRQSQEDQERAWIYMLHNQAPPLTRRPLATPTDAHSPSGFIPLAPLAAHAPSPLVAARAAAASLALHVNAGASTASPGTWASAVSQRSPVSLDHGMVKLEKGPHSSTGPVSASSAASQKKTPLLPLSGHSATSSVVFRSRMHTPGVVPEAPTPLAHVHRSTGGAMKNNSLMGVLTKRPREEDFVERDDDEECDYESGDETSARGHNGKRACLPKKCDFPLCKNSSRSRGFCYSHGGGRRCRVDGCANGAVSRDLCKRHGGGRRCRISGCKSSSESGGLCYSHGGGRRCNLSWCNARAKKGGYCAAHVDNRNALPPADVVESERHENEIDRAAMVTKVPVKIAARPLDSAATSVNPQVVETLLLLSKSPSQSEVEDNNDNSTSPSGADHLLSPRLSNPYAIASILN